MVFYLYPCFRNKLFMVLRSICNSNSFFNLNAIYCLPSLFIFPICRFILIDSLLLILHLGPGLQWIAFLRWIMIHQTLTFGIFIILDISLYDFPFSFKKQYKVLHNIRNYCSIQGRRPVWTEIKRWPKEEKARSGTHRSNQRLDWQWLWMNIKIHEI